MTRIEGKKREGKKALYIDLLCLFLIAYFALPHETKANLTQTTSTFLEFPRVDLSSFDKRKNTTAVKGIG